MLSFFKQELGLVLSISQTDQSFDIASIAWYNYYMYFFFFLNQTLSGMFFSNLF